MSDDFLSDLSTAVETGKMEPVTTVVTPASSTSSDEDTSDKDRAAVETSVLETMAPTPKPKKKEETAEKTTKEATEKTSEKTSETTQQVEKKDDPKLPFMDRFLKEDEKGNLVLADGTIIAASGKSRAFYEGLKKEGRDTREKLEKTALLNIQLGQKFKQLYTEFDKLKSNPPTSDLEKQTGMNSAEIADAVSLMKQFKQEPITAIKSILTQARMRGIDLSSIGVDGGFDPAVVQRAIAAAIQQARVDTTVVKPSQEEAMADAVREAEDFLKHNPTARPHTDTLAAAKNRFPDKSLDELWALLQIHHRKLAEEEYKKTLSSTPPLQREQQPAPRRVTTVPSTDYERMTFSQIAQSIKDDLA